MATPRRNDFATIEVTEKRGRKKFQPSALMLILKNRGEETIELSYEYSEGDVFLLSSDDGFLRLGPSTVGIDHVCFKKHEVEEPGQKCRLDIAVIR